MHAPLGNATCNRKNIGTMAMNGHILSLFIYYLREPYNLRGDGPHKRNTAGLFQQIWHLGRTGFNVSVSLVLPSNMRIFITQRRPFKSGYIV